MKYKVCSYLLQDGRWGTTFLLPQLGVERSEPFEFDVYFQTKKEADEYTVNFLKNDGITSEEIEIMN